MNTKRIMVSFEIEPEVWNLFLYKCRNENTTASAQLRAFVGEAVKDGSSD